MVEVMILNMSLCFIENDFYVLCVIVSYDFSVILSYHTYFT